MHRSLLAGSILHNLPEPAATAIARQAEVLETPDTRHVHPDYVAFPLIGILSICSAHLGAEVGSVGPEGGICTCGNNHFDVITQTPAKYIRVRNGAFTQLRRDHPSIDQLAVICNDWLATQARQIAACNATHHGMERIARFLLRASDALGGDLLPFTQEQIGGALGLRRTSVTMMFKEIGGIKAVRGKIKILNRAVLRSLACDCYDAFAPSEWPHPAVVATVPLVPLQAMEVRACPAIAAHK